MANKDPENHNMPAVDSRSGNEVRDRLDLTLLADPIVERPVFENGAELTPAEAAAMLGKSVRQVRRLLQFGKLNGRKIMGANGPEWRISGLHCERKEMQVACAREHAEPMTNERLSRLEANFEAMARELQIAGIRLATLEDRLRRFCSLEDAYKSTRSDVIELSDELQRQQARIDAVSVALVTSPAIAEVDEIAFAADDEFVAASTGSIDCSKPAKLPWWKTAFSLR